MPVSSSVLPWTLTMPAGSSGQWLFTLGTVNQVTGQGVPYPLAGTTWEYICRTTAGDTTPGGLFTITTTPGVYGQLFVTSTATVSTVQLTINPAATAALSPQTYYHALWMNPGTTAAYTWLTGSLIITGNPQP